MSVGCLREISFLFQLGSFTKKLLNHLLICRKNITHLGLNFTCSGPQASQSNSWGEIPYFGNREGWKCFWTLLCYISPMIRQPAKQWRETALVPVFSHKVEIHFDL